MTLFSYCDNIRITGFIPCRDRTAPRESAREPDQHRDDRCRAQPNDRSERFGGSSANWGEDHPSPLPGSGDSIQHDHTYKGHYSTGAQIYTGCSSGETIEATSPTEAAFEPRLERLFHRCQFHIAPFGPRAVAARAGPFYLFKLRIDEIRMAVGKFQGGHFFFTFELNLAELKGAFFTDDDYSFVLFT